MKRLHFSIVIQAPRHQVWDIMLAPETYQQWTVPFCEGCYCEGSWEQGATMRFLGPTGEGMLSQIAENRLHEFLSIRHLYCTQNGVENIFPEPIFENYTFCDHAEGTELVVAMDTNAEHEAMFSEIWPQALQLLKAICEKR